MGEQVNFSTAFLLIMIIAVTYSAVSWPNTSGSDRAGCHVLCRGAKAKNYEASPLYGCVCYDPMPAFVITGACK